VDDVAGWIVRTWSMGRLEKERVVWRGRNDKRVKKGEGALVSDRQLMGGGWLLINGPGGFRREEFPKGEAPKKRGNG